MKILHITPSMDLSTGGVCQAVRTMINGLREEQVYNEVICLDSPDAQHLNDCLFPVHALGPGKGPWRYSSKLTKWLVKELPSFDVVIVHGMWLYYSHAAIKAIKILRKRQSSNSCNIPKLYLMPHGMLDPYFQRAKERKWKAIRNTVYWKLVERAVVNDADGLLFTCEEECRLAKEPFSPYKPKKELIVGLGVENPPAKNFVIQEAFETKFPFLKDEPYVLFLSRVHEKKGVDLLIKAYAQLKRKYHHEMVLSSGLEDFMPPFPKLVIAGPGLDTTYGKEMENLTLIEGLKSDILFPGMLTGADKWGVFYNCEAFILPSHQENFGIAVVEAMACGKPVLISDQVNIWREIVAGGGGAAEPDTLKGTSKLLAEWVKMTFDEKHCMGMKARDSFQRDFSVKAASKRLLSMLFNNTSI
ncbi:glycosyltransferase [Pontibacter sp. SGAir0037]|uniref:glycosyltransferase n=1 Tax=Pontibacter sp. SGAir0037 TaxID=2571030 RepID=UPI0010CCFD55|nr:glycosyltransferase [Pontibacter sp. SGAir0037]QCR22595.1 glycosyl transferase family 1 [Pontibacter sp. SGAir0037]